MTGDQMVEWALRIVMSGTAVLVFLWGRSSKRTDELMMAQFAIRDQRIGAIERRLDHAGQKSSDLTDTVQTVIGQVAKLEGRLERA